MKSITKLYLALAVFLVSGVAFNSASAQVPNDISDFTSHGIHVILRNTNANDVIGVYLSVEGGLAYGETSNASVASAAAHLMSTSGSQKYPKIVYRDTMAKLTSTIAGTGDLYSMAFTLHTNAPNFNGAWDVFSDVVRNPRFDTTEWKRQQPSIVNAIEGRSSDPESYTSFVSDSLWKGNSPLNKVSTVSEVEGLSIDAMRSYYQSMMQRSRMLLVVVGKVSKSEIEQKLAAFESVPQGNFTMRPVDHITPPSTSSVHYIPRDLPTTYYEARLASAPLATADWWPQRVMLQILDNRLFDEVRTKRNLSYAPSAYATGTHGNWYQVLSLQSVLPDSANSVVLNEIRKLQTTLVPQQELENAKQTRVTTFFYLQQTNLQQAQNLAMYQRESGDWRNLFALAPESQKVTAAQIKESANKYMHHFQFVLLGPEGASHPMMYKFE